MGGRMDDTRVLDTVHLVLSRFHYLNDSTLTPAGT